MVLRVRGSTGSLGKNDIAKRLWCQLAQSGPMHSLTGSEHPSRSSEAKLFGIEFSYLHISKEDSIKPRRDQLYSQLFEAEYFADEDSVFVPANIAAIVDSSQLEPLRVPELRQLTRQSYRAGDVIDSRELGCSDPHAGARC